MVETLKVRIKLWMKNITPLKFFIGTSTVFGLTLLLVIPPFQGSDEPLHFYRAYQVSQFNLLVDKNIGNDYGGILPIALSDTVSLTTYGSSLGNLPVKQKYSLHRTAQAYNLKVDNTKSQWTNFTATALYPPISYIPQAAGILFARILGLPPIAMMYSGRLMNLIAWTSLIALSIHLMPRKKWAVAMVGLLPVALSQAVSLSADAMTIGLAAVFVASIFYLLSCKKPISAVSIGSLLAVMMLMALCKQIMVVLLPLALLLPKNIFMSRTHAWLTKALFVTAPLVTYGVWAYMIRNVDLKSVFSHHQNPIEQVYFVLHHPLEFVHVLWNTYFFSTGDSITHSFIGTFGWGEPSLAEPIVILGFIGLFLVMTINPYVSVKTWVSNRQKLMLGIIGVTYAVAVSAALYAYYNPVGAKTIAGLQGRYFLPLGFLAIPLFNSNWLKSSKRVYKSIAIIVPLFLLTASVVTLYARYYIVNP